MYFKEWPVGARWLTREIKIGDTPLGAENPVRVQSMTNTNTMDTKATVEQAIRMIDAGSEYVRITAPSVKDAENLRVIKKELQKQGYNTPLVADIHYNPKAAEIAARYVEKVRINPGNYVDKKLKGVYSFSDAEYQNELEKISYRLKPLLDVCKQYGTAIRIGSNHGSLSDRILGRYGDTPEGMTEAAMEFLRIMEDQNFYNTVISMKSSNTHVMIQSTRLMVSKMIQEGMNYPIHLGVTEAGDGEDGRIKSTVGIASLLTEGIGDTIRVSLTEAPEKEIPVANQIVNTFALKSFSSSQKPVEVYTNPFHFERRKAVIEDEALRKIPALVVGTANSFDVFKKNAPDLIAIDDKTFQNRDGQSFSYMRILLEKYNAEELDTLLRSSKDDFIVLDTQMEMPVGVYRNFFDVCKKLKLNNALIIKVNCSLPSLAEQQIYAAGIAGSLFADGVGDGVWMDGAESEAESLTTIALSILQASRIRISKTEFISCPTCGRTLFDMEAQLKVIKQKTSHLKGLKIGVMGCVVNGPGEMADADYGYVGAGPGKVNLYKGKTLVKKNIPSQQGLDALIALIKEHGDWRDE